MRKYIVDEPATKSKKREIKKRPRMKLHGIGLKKMLHAGQKIATR